MKWRIVLTAIVFAVLIGIVGNIGYAQSEAYPGPGSGPQAVEIETCTMKIVLSNKEASQLNIDEFGTVEIRIDTPDGVVVMVGHVTSARQSRFTDELSRLELSLQKLTDWSY